MEQRTELTMQCYDCSDFFEADSHDMPHSRQLEVALCEKCATKQYLIDHADDPMYVIHSNGQIYVQEDDESQFGFSLCDEEGCYPGGFVPGCGNHGEWERLDKTDPRLIAYLEQLD